MHLIDLFPLGLLAAAVSGQSLIQALGQHESTEILSTNLAYFYPELVDLVNNSKNVTLLVPSDDAIAKFVDNFGEDNFTTEKGLKHGMYHILDGVYPTSAFNKTPIFPHTFLNDTLYTNITGGQRVKISSVDSNITITSGLLTESHILTPNINITSGIMHIIDRVLTIPASISDTALITNLTALAAALETSNLTETIDSRPNVTLFAPDNAAFEAIPNPSNITEKDLVNILKNHVVDGIVYSDGLKSEKLRNENGTILKVQENNNTMKVESSEVVTKDVLVSNGVLHIIDSVILNVSSKALPPLQGGAAGSSMLLHPGLQAISALMVVFVFAL